MGLLDQVIGGLTGNTGSSSPIQNVLMSLLSGNSGGYAPVQSTPSAGGLGGLISMFEGAGLGQLAQSWISRGANQPVSPDQLKSVFGTDRVQHMANQSGMAPESFLQQLSHHLPTVVDKLTPNGSVPDEGTLSV